MNVVNNNMHRNIFALVVIGLAFICVPTLTYASHEDKDEEENVSETSLDVAGWIPYWTVKEGTASARKHLDQLSAVYPFVYTVRQDGSIHDNGHIKGKEWQKLFREARKKDVEVIPTIMSGDGALINAILLDEKRREQHIEEIVEVVEKGKFDGIDIDYEGRTKVSVDAFSAFLKELNKELGKKKLVCTLEPRTPPDSLWRTVPNPLPYSNDYEEIKKHCDVIQIMTYDQQRADLKLNDARSGKPYYPNADPVWVEKVVKESIKTLPEDKIMLGVPTYGRSLMVTVSPNWFREYASLSAINEPKALEIAKREKVTPSVNDAGEKVITYFPTTMSKKAIDAVKKMPVPKDTPSGLRAAMQSLAYANKTGGTVVFHMVTWSDADSIKDKIKIAEEYDLKGVAIFKIDGQEDSDIWKLF